MEPERDIEKQLKAYAKKRREDAGAPMEMHPATRRMLQSEAARLSKQAATKSDRRQTLYRLWPRLVLTGSIFVLLAIGSWVLLFNHRDSETKFRLAFEKEKAESRSAGEPMRQIAPAKQSPSSAENRVSSAEKSRTLSLDAPTESDAVRYGSEYSYKSNDSAGYFAKDSDRAQSIAPVPPTASAPAATPAPQPIPAPKQESLATGIRAEESKLMTRSASTVARKRDSNTVEEKVPASVAATAGTSSRDVAQDKNTPLSEDVPKLAEAQISTSGGTLLSFSNAYRITNAASDLRLGALGGSLPPANRPDMSTQMFARLKPQSGKTSVGGARQTAVLDNFSVEQTGNSIRIVDGDGSTYTGSLQTVVGKPATFALDDEHSDQSLMKKELKTAASNSPQRRPGEVRGLAQGVHSTNNYIYSFRVSGTNLTLNQPVLFTGDLFAFADTISVTNSLASITNKAKAAPTGEAAAFAERPVSQVRGEAIVGGTNQIKIDALRVSPKK